MNLELTARLQQAALDKAIQKLGQWPNLRLSYSAYASFKECPMQGILQVTWVVPGKAKPYNVARYRGMLVHDALKLVLADSLQNPRILLTDEAFVAAVDKARSMMRCKVDYQGCDPEAFHLEVKESMRRLYPVLRESDGYRLLKTLYHHHYECEGSYAHEVFPGLEIRGRRDLTIDVGEKHVVLFDWKTGNRRYVVKEQLVFYALPYYDWGHRVEGGFLHLLEPALDWRTIEPVDWLNLHASLEEVYAQVKRLDFPAQPQEWRCKWCDFQDLCTAYQLSGLKAQAYREEIDALPEGSCPLY